MLGSKDLKPKIAITESTVECPVIGCAEKVKRQRKSFKRKPEFQCPNHKIYISPTTFEYPEESDNFLWTSAEDQRLQKNIKKVKRESRMARDNSEDALSWNVFRYLETANQLSDLLSSITQSSVSSIEPIYWSYSQMDHGVWSPLVDARSEFGEDPQRSSEPDIIVESDKAIFFIEAKFTAGNKTKPSNLSERKKYLTGGNNWFEQVFNSDYETLSIGQKKYELMRFWLLGTWMADRLDKDFYLVNLVLEDREKNIEDLFKPHIKATTTRKFLRLSWEYIYQHILSHSQSNPDKDRLLSYFKNKTTGYNHLGELQMAFSL
jgi:hypothetical protein